MLIRLKETIKPLMVDRMARRLALFSLVMNALAWALLLIRLSPLIASGRIIALHYNVYLNVNEVGAAGWALRPAIIGSVILALNFALAARSYRSSRQNAIVLLAVTCFYELLAFLAGFFIILVNLAR